MTKLSTLKKLEKLNENDSCVGIMSYVKGEWEIHALHGPLSMANHYPFITGKTATEVINKAYKFVFGK